MDLINRFINYVKIDTESDPNSDNTPSTLKQFDLANLLKEELEKMGASEIYLSDKCVLYAKIPSNINIETKTIGLIAHLDTSCDMSGKNVKPQLLKNYQGNKITINKELNITLDPETFPSLKNDIGSDLIFTDGTTLLGADDKAGVALIMDLCQTLLTNNQIKHGDIAIAFTPDEEVGRGTENFDLKRFNADYAYTIDGGDVNDIEFENFNAASAIIHIKGKSIHPGDAKGKMLNSQLIAFEFNNLLPVFDNPAYTENYEGFNHLISINGNCEDTKMEYILRNHDKVKLLKQISDFQNAIQFINNKYGKDTISLKINHEYENMRSIIENDMTIIDSVKEKMLEIGLKPTSSAIRGGTDGAHLTYMGLPCPNLGTGGRNFHGKYEYLNINDMRKMAQLLIKIVEVK